MKHQSFKVPSLPWNNVHKFKKKITVAEIEKEINKYPVDIIEEFLRLFPNKNDIIGVKRTNIILKPRSIGFTHGPMMKVIIEYFGYQAFVKDKENFWYRWNRFKKLIPFL